MDRGPFRLLSRRGLSNLLDSVIVLVLLTCTTEYWSQMSSERIPYPFKIRPLDDNVQKKIADDFEGYPNGLVSCNHYDFKLSATLTEEQMEELYNYPLDERDVWVVTPPKCGTTWSQEMIWLIANDFDYEGAKTLLMPERCALYQLASRV